MAAQLMARNGTGGSAAVVVDCPGHHVLAGAGLTEDQDRHVLGRDPADRLVDLLHGGATPNEQVRHILGRPPVRHDCGDPHQAADLEGPRNQFAKGVELQRLQQVLVGPEAHRLDGGGGGPMPGDEDDRNLGDELMDSAENLQAGLVWQVNVQDDRVGPIESHTLQLPRPPTSPSPG